MLWQLCGYELDQEKWNPVFATRTLGSVPSSAKNRVHASVKVASPT